MGVKTRKTYTSKGQRRSVSKKLCNAIRKDRPETVKLLHKVRAWAKGKRVMVTIANPNPNETNKRFIRVEATHPAAFGPWKKDIKDIGIKIAND